MTTRLALAVAMTLGLALPAYSAVAAAPAASAAQQANPFFADSTLPLHYPQFDKIKDSDFAPAFDAGMAEQLKEMDAIANNPAAPTFENTIIAMEKSGQVLDRATTVFFNLVGTDTNDARNKLRADYSAKFAAHGDAISLNPKLFARIKALYDQRNTLGLDSEGVRLIERYHERGDGAQGTHHLGFGVVEMGRDADQIAACRDDDALCGELALDVISFSDGPAIIFIGGICSPSSNTSRGSGLRILPPMSGTWASTLLAAIRSAWRPAAASSSASATPKNRSTTAMPLARAAAAVLAVGSTP